MKKLMILIFACLALLAYGCGGGKTEGKAETGRSSDSMMVDVIKLAKMDFIEYGDYYGKASGYREAMLICFAGGKVEKIFVKEGQRVKKGQSLASIDGEKVKTAYETAKLSEKVAHDNYKRMQRHAEDGNASKVALDQSKMGWLNAKQMRLEAEKLKDGGLCIAPFSGIVTSRLISEYQELPPGSPTFGVCQLHKIKISIGIPEGDIAGVKEGNRAEISFKIYPNRKWIGQVHSISREASKFNRAFATEIHVDNPDRLIKAGLTGHVKLHRRTLKDRIVVPTGSILTLGEQNYVMLEDAGTAIKTPVAVGPSNNTHTVIADGLEAGQILIVKGAGVVADGSLVKTSKEMTE